MKEKGIKRKGRILAWLLSVAMAFSMVNVPKKVLAESVSGANATDSGNPVYVEFKKDASQSTGNYDQYEMKLYNNSGSEICDWMVTIAFSGDPGFNAGWNGVSYDSGSKTIKVQTYGESTWNNATIYNGQSAGGAGFQIAPGALGLASVTITYSQGVSSTGPATGTGSSSGSGGNGGTSETDTSTNKNLDVEYNYAKLLQESLYFYDANMCGRLEGKCGIGWRRNCHVYDANVSTTINGVTYNVDASGGFHDAGDHVKFGLPQGYAAAMLGMSYYEFPDAYEENGLTSHLQTITDYFCDYFKRCTVYDSSRKVVGFCYQVGEGNSDHGIWSAPETQTLNRPAYFATASNPATDEVSVAIAALAINYINFKNAEDLQTAKDLFTFVQSNSKSCATQGASGFYDSATWQDDYALAASALWIATNDTAYKSIYDANKGGVNQYWVLDWANSGAMASMLAGDSSTLASVTDVCKGKPTIDNVFHCVSDWGSCRYSAAEQFTGLVYDKLTNSSKYTAWATSQMNYMIGDNPNKRCYIVGYNENSSKYPHHRAASRSTDANITNSEHYTLLGALVGGPGSNGVYKDNQGDYYCNEVALDYNAGLVGAAAGLYHVHKNATSTYLSYAKKTTTNFSTTLASAEELSAIGVTKYYGDSQSPTPTPKAVLEASATKFACTAKEYGYTSADAAEVTISNTGDASADDISAVLTKGQNFVIKKVPAANLAAGNNTTVSVVPKTGLAAGTYEDTLTVTYDSTKTVKVTVSFTVTKRNVTITADNLSKDFGEENPTLTYQMAGTVVSGDSLGIQVTTNAKKESNAGTYDINVTASNPNYQITCRKGILTIRKKTVSDVAFPSVNNTVKIDDAVSAALFSGGDTAYGTFAWANSSQTFTQKGMVNVDMVLTLSADAKTNYDFSSVAGYAGETIKRTLTVTVLAKDAPSITFPTASDIVYGQAIGTSALSFTETQYGTYAWKNANLVPDKTGKQAYTVVFTPNQEAIREFDLKSIEQDVSVNVRKQVNSQIPEKAVLVKRTADSIEVRTSAGVQYSIDNGSSWTADGFAGKFTGLQAFTKYQIKARYAETDIAEAGAASSTLEVYTLVADPYIIDVSKLTDANYVDALKLVKDSGEEMTVTYSSANNTLQLLHNAAVYADGYVLTGSNPGLTVKTGAGDYKLTLQDAVIKCIDAVQTSKLQLELSGDSKVTERVTGASKKPANANALTVITGTGSLETGKLAADGDIEIQGGKITAGVIEGTNIMISGGDVTATDHIKAENQVIISGTGTAVTAGNKTGITGSAAIYAEDKIEITGGTVTVTTPEGNDIFGLGVGADGSIIVDGGMVKGNPTYSKQPTDKNGQILNSIVNAVVSAIAEQAYTGQAIKPAFTITLDGKTLTTSDFTVSYSNNVEPGTATITINGANGYCGEKIVSFMIVKKDDNPGTGGDNPGGTTPNDPGAGGTTPNDPGTGVTTPDDPDYIQPTPPVDDPDTGIIKKGEVYKIGNFSYKVTKPLINGKGTVAVTKAVKKGKTVTIPATVKINGISFKVTEISANAFKNDTKMTTLKIGKNVTKIGNQAFYGCTKLKTATLGSGVTTIGKKAFYNCKSMTKMTISSKKLKKSNVGAGAFTKMGAKNYKKLTMKVPKAKLKDYKKIFKAKGLSKKASVKK